MRYSSGVFARFKKSHFTEDATRDALPCSALTKSGAFAAMPKHVIFTILTMIISIREYYSRYANIELY